MKNWKILSEYNPDIDLVTQLLDARGIKDVTGVEEFLNTPALSHYTNNFPEELKAALMAARHIILNCIKTNVPIVVHGDYDADGICATAILYNALKTELRYSHVFSFIPSRFENGYGLSQSSIDELTANLKTESVDLSKGILLITVDSGITAVAEVDYAKSLGYSVIITDHHQKPEKLPAADCLVWSDEVVGSGISWFLSRVLGSKSTQDIALAAIATITDLQPVLGINRAIVKRGLEVINTNPPLGVKKLIDIAGRTGEISAYELGWVVGPRINASGRLVRATEALRLFVETDPQELDKIANTLNETNILRQDKTLQMFELASVEPTAEVPKIIFSISAEYHEGIIGLVAAKLVQKYYRPSVVISINENIGKGSVRSIPGVDIITMLRKVGHLFENVGGHPMAAGFTIKKEKLDDLKRSLLDLAETDLQDEHFQRVLNVDLLLPAQYIDMAVIHKLEKLKPFGLGNEEPVFATYGFGIVSASPIGQKSQHLVLKLFENGKYYKAIYFNEGHLASELQLGDKVDLAYSLKKNEYDGKTSVDLVIKDLIVKNPLTTSKAVIAG